MNSDGILSFMDFLDLDEELIDQRAKNLMEKQNLTNEHLANLMNLLSYKQLINTREESDCCNTNEFNFTCTQLIHNLNDDNINITCKVIKAILMLSPSTIVDKAEHLIQQILHEMQLPEPKLKANADSDEFAVTLLQLRVCDSILDAVLQTGYNLILPFLETPLERIICSRNKTLKAYFLTNTVSQFFLCIAGYELLDRIWNLLLQLRNGSIALKVLSCLSNFYLPITGNCMNMTVESNIILDKEFWNFILFGLASDDVTTRKHGIYLAKRAIDFAFKINKYINISSRSTFIWDDEDKTYNKKIWDDYFTLIDTLDEKQSNIVMPSLKLFDAINDIGDCWLNCAFNIGLRHDNAQVRFKCLQYRFKFQIKCGNDAVHVLEAVNDINLYEHRDHCKQLKIRLKDFFLNDITIFYVLKVLPLVKWSPVPLYHLTTILADITVDDLGDRVDPTMIYLIGKLLNVSCNNIEIRTAICINLSYFIGKCCKGLEWDQYINLFSTLQLHELSPTSENPFIQYIGKELMVINRQRFLLYISSSPNCMDFGVTYFESHNDFAILVYANNMIVKIQNINSQPHSCKSLCLEHAIFLSQLYKRIIQRKGPFFDRLNERSDTILQVLLDYVVSLLTSPINIFIQEIYLLFEGLDELNKEVENKTVSSMFESALLLLKDENTDVDNKAIVIFIINCCLKSPAILELAQDEAYLKTFIESIVNIKFKNQNKENCGRMKNAFFEKACEITYTLIMKNLSDVDKILNFVECMLESGGYGCLKWIIKIMNRILANILDDINLKFDVTQFLKKIWQEIEELKSNNQYSICIEEFVALIMQDALLKRPEYNNVVILYCNKIIEYAVVKNAPLYYLVNRIDEINISKYMHMIYVLCDILLYSSVPRKDHRITENLIADIIQKPGINFEREEPDYEISKSSVIFDSDIKMYGIRVLSKITDPNTLNTLMTVMIGKVDEMFRNKQRYHANSQHERVLQSCLQNLLFIFLKSRQVDLDATLVWVVEFLGRIPHQPFVKICFEWYIALYFYNQDTILNADILTKLKERNVPLQSQFMILYWLVIHKIKRKRCVQDEFEYVMEFFLSHIMGPIYSTRLYAQYLTMKVFDANVLVNSDKYTFTVNVIKNTIAQNAEANDKSFIKLTKDHFVHAFDIVEDLTPGEIYWRLPKCVGENIYHREGIKKDFIESTIQVINNNISEGSSDVFLNEWIETHSDHELFVEEKSNNASIKELDFENDSDQGIIQKKYVPWKDMSEIDVCDVDKKREKSKLIVVASLIDKLPNLGGMARTSEVFGVKTYVIDSLRHIQDKKFQGLSVSAERWIDVEEVRPANLKDYLMSRKAEGYSIVAAEQTSGSKQLQNFKFPEKTLLLLGHEKEGVPCDLLPLMDECVEIPQKGVIRSLNVHVTAAIFIWEYARQIIF